MGWRSARQKMQRRKKRDFPGVSGNFVVWREMEFPLDAFSKNSSK